MPNRKYNNWSLVFCLCFALCACLPVTEQNQIAKIQAAGVLKVGTIYGSSTYYLASDGAAGFEFELAQAFADALNVKLEIIPVYDLHELFDLLDNNTVDLLAAGITVTPERQKKYRFAPSYQSISEKLVYKQGAERPRDWSDLNGSLVVTEKSSHLKLLQEKAPNTLEWSETSSKDSEELIQMVLNEKIDYTIVDSNLLAVNRRVYPELAIAFTVRKQQPQAWAFSRQADDSLFAHLIRFFGEYRSSGQYAQLEDKYFGHVRNFDYVDTRVFIRAIADILPKYRNWFEQYAGEYNLDWKLLAAQSYQESHWNPKALSPTGVRGIMMLTLPTAKQMKVNNRLDAQQNIRGGARYLSSLHQRIPARIQEPDRTWFALAAYNIGLGHLEDARRLTQGAGDDPDKWHQVKKYLPLLQKKSYYKRTRYGYARGNEAVNYVENIRRYHDSLVWFFGKE